MTGGTELQKRAISLIEEAVHDSDGGGRTRPTELGASRGTSDSLAYSGDAVNRIYHLRWHLSEHLLRWCTARKKVITRARSSVPAISPAIEIILEARMLEAFPAACDIVCIDQKLTVNPAV